jgi:hypothetical protein
MEGRYMLNIISGPELFVYFFNIQYGRHPLKVIRDCSFLPILIIKMPGHKWTFPCIQ